MTKVTSRRSISTVQKNYMIIEKHYGRLRREFLTQSERNKVFDGRTPEDRLHDQLLRLALGPLLSEEQLRSIHPA